MSDSHEVFSTEYVKASETTVPSSPSISESTTAGLRQVGSKSNVMQKPYEDPAKPRRIITRAKII